MPRLSRGSLKQRQALNEASLLLNYAPVILKPGEYVRALRGLLRMSQRQLARRCGLPQSHLSDLETGRIDPTLGTLRKAFSALFCDVVVLPRPLKKPTQALGERYAESRGKPWD